MRMNTIYLLSLIATTAEATICFFCSRQLWHMRKDSRDRSRVLLAAGSLTCGLLATFSLIGSMAAAEGDAGLPLLHPYIGWFFLSMHILMTLYPITVVKPGWLTPRRYFFLFLPTAIFAIALVFFTGHWTPLHTVEQLRENISRPDVIIRLLSQIIMLPYCFILFMLPYNYRHSSATFRWTLNYSLGLMIICCTHLLLMVTYHPPLMIALPLLAAVFYAYSTEYELEDRLQPSNATEEESESAQSPTLEPVMEPGLWSRICQVMDQEEAWRDPDLTLTSMTHLCGTNVTYLNKIIREETGGGFKEMVNNKRIESVVAQLKENPDVDIQDAFFNAGFRSRITAWRNFKDIMGVTPTEYRSTLRKA